MTDETPAALTYAIADLHGRRDLLEAALAAIIAHSAGRPRTIVFLGDYVDRGPMSADVLARLIEGPSDGWRWICLKGNHEAIMSLGLRHHDRLDWWIENGGESTIVSYRDRQELIAGHLAWIDQLRPIHVDLHRVYVHAGVDPRVPLAAQAERTLLWKRTPTADARGHGTYHVVHGHEPNVDGPLCLAGRTDLDTLAWSTGRLVVGVFADDLAGGPIDLIEVRRDPS